MGTSQVSATTQLLEFRAFRIVSGSAGQHMFVSVGGGNFGANFQEINGGTGTDPNTTLDKSASFNSISPR